MAEIEQGGGKREEGGVIGRFPTRDPVLLTSYLSSDPVATLTRLKCSNVEIERGRRIAEYRAQWPDASDPVSVRRWMAQAGSAVDDLLAIANAEGWGAELESVVNEVRASKAPLTVGDLAVNGNDLQAAGVPAGPMLGELLRELLEHVIENPLMNQRDLLLARVRERLREGGGGRSTAHQQHDPRDREGDRRRR